MNFTKIFFLFLLAFIIRDKPMAQNSINVAFEIIPVENATNATTSQPSYIIKINAHDKKKF